jgi:1-acyl-sn-glycerol-3-phosphate acyltransferase
MRPRRPLERSVLERLGARLVIGTTAGAARVTFHGLLRAVEAARVRLLRSAFPKDGKAGREKRPDTSLVVRNHNADVLHRVLRDREHSNGGSGRSQKKFKRAILTVCNHASVIDDPTIWGVFFNQRELWGDPDKMRFAWAAEEIVWSSALRRLYFTLGQAIPVVRGDGLDQPGVHEAIERLRGFQTHFDRRSETDSLDGAAEAAQLRELSSGPQWIHVFSEGKVNLDGDSVANYGLLPFRWGIAHLLLETHPAWASATMCGREDARSAPDEARERLETMPRPVVLPFFHYGYHRFLKPTEKIPSVGGGRRLSTLFGEPVCYDDLLDELAASNATREEARIRLSSEIEHSLRRLGGELRERDAAEGFHDDYAQA